MTTKISRRAALAAFALLALGTLHAGEIKPYDKASVAKLADQGRPVVLAVHASWCPTCKAQGVILDKLMRAPAYRGVTLFVIDFDTAKPLLSRLKVDQRATLIAYKGKKEVARSSFETEPAAIESMLKKALG